MSTQTCTRCKAAFVGSPMLLGALRLMVGVGYKMAAERFCGPCLGEWVKYRNGTDWIVGGSMEDELLAFERGGAARVPPC